LDDSRETNTERRTRETAELDPAPPLRVPGPSLAPARTPARPFADAPSTEHSIRLDKKERVRAHGPEGRLVDAVLDFRNPYFIGLRTDEALIRFLGRNHWGAPVGIGVHDFAPDADAQADVLAGQGWLDGVFSQP
jgi:hypothetical protein